MGSGASETSLCSFCGKMSTNHYCCAKVPNSNIIIEARGDNEHVCGKAMCILCRNNWGDAEKYTNYCKDHHPDEKDNSEKNINVAGKNKNVASKSKPKPQNKKTKKKRGANVVNLSGSNRSTKNSQRNRNSRKTTRVVYFICTLYF